MGGQAKPLAATKSIRSSYHMQFCTHANGASLNERLSLQALEYFAHEE